MNAQIVRKETAEITGIGAAIAAGIHVKFWSGLEEVEHKIKIEKVFSPAMEEEARLKKRARWAQAVQRSIGFGWAN